MNDHGHQRSRLMGTRSALRQRYPDVVLGNLAEAKVVLAREHQRRVEALNLEYEGTLRLLDRWEAAEAALVAQLPEYIK